MAALRSSPARSIRITVMRRLPGTLRGKMHDIAWSPGRCTRAECCHAKGAMTSGAGRNRRSSCRRRDLRLATYDSGGMGHHGPGRGGGSLWSRGLGRRAPQGGCAACLPDGSITRAVPSAALLGPCAPVLPLNRAPSLSCVKKHARAGGAGRQAGEPAQAAPRLRDALGGGRRGPTGRAEELQAPGPRTRVSWRPSTVLPHFGTLRAPWPSERAGLLQSGRALTHSITLD